MRSSRRIILNHLLVLLLAAAMMASLIPAGLFCSAFAAEAFAEELLPGEDPAPQGEEETDDDLPGDPPSEEDEEEEEDREQEKEKEEQELKEKEQKEEEKEEEEKEEEEQEEEDLLPENTVILPEGLPEEGDGNEENTDPLPANEEKQEGASEENLKEDPEKDPEELPEETPGDVPSGPVTLDGKPVEDSITSGLSLLNPLFPHTEEEILLAEAVTADDQLLRGNRLMASLKPGVSGSTIYSQDIDPEDFEKLEIDTDDCVPYEEAIAAIRGAMVRREASIDLAYHSGTTSLSKIEELSALFDDVAAHTGNPQEGDYLRYHYRQLCG